MREDARMSENEGAEEAASGAAASPPADHPAERSPEGERTDLSKGSEWGQRADVFPAPTVQAHPISEILDSAGPIHGEPEPVEAAPAQPTDPPSGDPASD